MRDKSTLAAVSNAQAALTDARESLTLEAEAWVARKLVEFEKDVDRAVIEALEDNHSVSNVARAYTLNAESTPNRNAIYKIIARHRDEPVMMGDYPFEWVERTVTTAAGKKKVFDVHVKLTDFGPNEISGEYTWRYDLPTDTLDEQLGSEDPYPVQIKYYKQVLDRWLMSNPYPGEG